MSLKRSDTVLSGVLEELRKSARDLFMMTEILSTKDAEGKQPSRKQLDRLKALAKEIGRHAEVLP